MPVPPLALELENRSLGPHGAPTLYAAYEALLDAWRSGDRDRELALHLFFLAWYVVVEPPHLTGAQGGQVDAEAAVILRAMDAHLLPDAESSEDAEALYVIGLAALMFPWVFCCGDELRTARDCEQRWIDRSARYRRRYRELRPNGIDPSVFEGRGAFGDYYAGQAGVQGGN